MRKIFNYILPKIAKRAWYIILLLLSTIYIFNKKDSIWHFNELNTANIIFLIWLILVLLPLFNEIEIFGIKFKKDFEKAISGVNENLRDLRVQIMEIRLNNSNANTINQYLCEPTPTAKDIEELEKNNSLNDRTTEDHLYFNIENEVSEKTVYLFKVRFIIERILESLCDLNNYDGPLIINQMLRFLMQREVLNFKSVELIRQITNIANRGIHGEIISSEYIDFVYKAVPTIHDLLNDTLEKIKKKTL